MKWLAALLTISQVWLGSPATPTPTPVLSPTDAPWPVVAEEPAAEPTATPSPTASSAPAEPSPAQAAPAEQADVAEPPSGQIHYTQDDIEELARIIYFEARGESEAGQLAVANVVLNRVQHPQWPDSIREVIYQNGQFTPTQSRAYTRTRIPDAYRQIALRALNGESAVCCENVTYFSQGKARYMQSAFRMGHHWFGHCQACEES